MVRVPQGSILSPLLLLLLFFLIYINDVPTLSNRNTKILLYGDDTSIIVNSPNPFNYQIIMEEIICNINKWFKANLLPLKLEKKTHWLQFSIRKNFSQDTQIA
jgi:hypothetical protein